MDNLTAKMSCFVRGYHANNSKSPLFSDDFAKDILSGDYDIIAKSITDNAGFFLKDYKGDTKDALGYIVDRQLAPSVLARSAYCERMLENEIALGCKQYVLPAAGYDTYALRKPNRVKVFELDLPDMIEDKKRRIENAGLESTAVFIGCDLSHDNVKELLLKNGFDKRKKSFVGLLGISYYLEKQDFKRLLMIVSEVLSAGSAICFDYPSDEEGKESKTIRSLAEEAGEKMKARYSYGELEMMLQDCNFLIYEYLGSDEMSDMFFSEYNGKNEGFTMTAPQGVGYIFAVKKNRV